MLVIKAGKENKSEGGQEKGHYPQYDLCVCVIA